MLGGAETPARHHPSASATALANVFWVFSKKKTLLASAQPRQTGAMVSHKDIRMRFAACAALIAWAAAAPVCLAANANNPYGNVNHRNDAGNDTGDSQVDRLNEAELSGGVRPGLRPQSRAYPGYAQRPGYPAAPYGYRPAPYGYAPGAYPPPGSAPPPGYAPQPGYPPPGYQSPGYASPGY